MGMWPSKDSFRLTHRKRVTATQLTPTSAQPQDPEHLKVSTVSEEEDEREPVPLASKKVSNYGFD
jgi:hypothetical protein